VSKMKLGLAGPWGIMHSQIMKLSKRCGNDVHKSRNQRIVVWGHVYKRLGNSLRKETSLFCRRIIRGLSLLSLGSLDDMYQEITYE
jgi:hypothetical protein